MISYLIISICLTQITEMCPYYFNLEDKFLEQAGIKPSATTDELFDVDVDTDFCADIPVDDVDTGMQSKPSV